MKTKYLIHFLLLFSIQVTNACVLNGNWRDNYQNDWIFHQNGTAITGMIDKEIINGCGKLVVFGNMTESGFSLALHFEGGRKPCPSGNAIGVFQTDDCSKASGTVTDDYGYQYKFALGKNVSEFVKIIEPAEGQEFAITAESRMPILKVKAQLVDLLHGFGVPQFAWNSDINHVLPNGRIIKFELPEYDSDDLEYQPNFSAIRGGNLKITLEYYRMKKDERTFKIVGTNPGKALIEGMLPDFIPRQIACQESRYRQFDAKREGGKGLPLMGRTSENKPIGGIGLFQLYDPPPFDGAVWNWHENIADGLLRLKKKRDQAKALHLTERNRLNDERQAKGLPNCPQGIPIPLTEEQLDREMIRRYNCGREYRWEPRDAKDCAGKWISKPTCVKRGADLDYVNKVLNCKN